MGLYWKAAAAVLLAVVMMLMLRRQEIGVLLGIAVCAMVAVAAMDYLDPVAKLLHSLEALGNLDTEMVTILLKTVGIGLVTEIASMICTDSGSASLGKAVQLLGTSVILWLSVPLFTALLDLIREILEGL
ncbi:MAG: hypothetical protein IJZ39_09785 [Oscillospiraceae bacterium]|nr:hypothetical protein [Oscillospiraceae bacterium]